MLEGKVIGRITSSKVRSRSGSYGLSWCYSRSNLSRLSCYTVHLPSTDGVVPTTLVLAGIHIERYRQLFTHLYIELLNLFSAKHIEAHLTWVLTVILDNILLHFPLVAVLRHAAPWSKYGDDFSCKFHTVFLLLGAKIRFFAEITQSFALFSPKMLLYTIFFLTLSGKSRLKTIKN